MKKDILSFWPKQEFKPRESQIVALKWLEKQDDSKYIFLGAPVGFGKSLVALTYSRWLSGNKGNSFVLVPQIILQKQYENEVLDDAGTLLPIFGKSNYKCQRFNTTCDIGALLKKCKTSCEYTKAIKRSKNTNNLIMNYTLALLMFGFTDMFDKRSLMICDEAHNLESMLVDFNLLTISKKRTDSLKLKLGKFSDIKDGYNWIKDVYLPALIIEVENIYEDVRDIIDNVSENSSKHDLAMVKHYDQMLVHSQSIDIFISDKKQSYNLDYVMISDNFKLEFKPIYGKDNFNDMLKHQADKFLFMSGTILDQTQMCLDLGIPKEDTVFLELPSEFDVDNRPVVAIDNMKMNAAWNNPENELNREKYLNTIDTILNLHEGESGLIHTGNFKISEFIVDHLRKQSKFKIYHHNPESGNNRNDTIKQFIDDNKPRILVSPSVTEGLDLKHDKGRFSIIAKIPYGNLGDKWVKRRLDLSQSWYAVQAAKDIIQACGRVVRTVDDYGTTYIVDGSWAYFYSKNKHLFPKWWKSAYIKM